MNPCTAGVYKDNVHLARYRSRRGDDPPDGHPHYVLFPSTSPVTHVLSYPDQKKLTSPGHSLRRSASMTSFRVLQICTVRRKHQPRRALDGTRTQRIDFEPVLRKEGQAM